MAEKATFFSGNWLTQWVPIALRHRLAPGLPMNLIADIIPYKSSMNKSKVRINKNKFPSRDTAGELVFMPVMGVEPIRCHHQRILSPSRLPIPTHRLMNSDIIITALRRVVKPGGGICHFLKKQIFLKKSVDKRPARRYNYMRRLMTGAALYCPIAQLVRAPDC